MDMTRYRVVDKEVGETPLQALERLRASDPSLAGVAMTYAGRLDPMAEGKLLILIGEECKRKDLYNALDKEYEFELLFGFETDTGDLLGLAERAGTDTDENAVRDAIRSLPGTYSFPYPKFSSKNINSKNPTTEEKEMRVMQASCIDVRTIRSHDLRNLIFHKIGLLRADASDGALQNNFRKSEILSVWEPLLPVSTEEFLLVRARAIVSPGTYIRSLVPYIGRSLGSSALAYSIRRTKIGTYRAIGPLGVWTRLYT